MYSVSRLPRHMHAVSVALVFSTMSQCTARQPVAPLPQLNWEMAEINATEGSIEITCFTSDSGSTEPYQVSVNSRGKGTNPATSGKMIYTS
jgi:hypothetical protein